VGINLFCSDARSDSLIPYVYDMWNHGSCRNAVEENGYI
jgi:hypothetical protein